MPTATKSRRNTDEYVLGTDATETARLGLQHRLWSEAAHHLWELARVRPGQTVLDVGCGPGHAALDLAQIVGPTGRVIGIDESAPFLKQLHDQAQARRLSNVTRVLGDVQQIGNLLSTERGKIDLAYARWLLCFVPDPEAVVAGLASLLRPGGRFAIQDYFNYEYSLTLAPRTQAFEIVIAAVGKSWRSRGGDPDIVGRLPAILLKHGFRIDHLDVNQRIARPGHTMWHWPTSFWDSFVPRLVETNFISESQMRDFDQAWKDATANPASFCLLPPVFDIVAVKE